MEALNITLKSAFHALPTNTDPKTEHIPLPMALEELRHHYRHLHRRVVLVLQYYLHLTFYSLGVFRDRARAAKEHIGRFLKANPGAKVLIRGPHTVFSSTLRHMKQGDVYGPAYVRVWAEEFEELRDRVWFLDFWDMSIATENMDNHPTGRTVTEMVKLLLGYICEGES